MAIRAIVAVAKSTPAPPGLKGALTKDSDFLTLLARLCRLTQIHPELTALVLGA
jgi:hypothetical protein